MNGYNPIYFDTYDQSTAGFCFEDYNWQDSRAVVGFVSGYFTAHDSSKIYLRLFAPEYTRNLIGGVLFSGRWNVASSQARMVVENLANLNSENLLSECEWIWPGGQVYAEEHL